MPECAKTHLQQSRISKFSGGGPPLQGEGREEREGKGKGGEEQEGKEGRNGGGGCGELDMAPPPLEKLWICPLDRVHHAEMHLPYRHPHTNFSSLPLFCFQPKVMPSQYLTSEIQNDAATEPLKLPDDLS